MRPTCLFGTVEYYVDLLNIVYCKSSLSYAYLMYLPIHFGPSVQIYLNSLLVSKLIRNSLENKVMTGFCALSIQVTQPVITLFICYTKVITYNTKIRQLFIYNKFGALIFGTHSPF